MDEQSKQALEGRLREWERHTLARHLESRPERKPEFKTQAMKWPVKRLYTPLDLSMATLVGVRELVQSGP